MAANQFGEAGIARELPCLRALEALAMRASEE